METYATKNITKIDKYKKKKKNKTEQYFHMEYKTEHNYTLVSQATNIHRSNKEVTNLKAHHEKG